MSNFGNIIGDVRWVPGRRAIPGSVRPETPWVLPENSFTIDDIINLSENVLTDSAQFTEESVSGGVYPVVTEFDPSGLDNYNNYTIEIRDAGSIFNSSFLMSDDGGSHVYSFGKPNCVSSLYNGYKLDALGDGAVDMMMATDNYGLSLVWTVNSTSSDVGSIYYDEYDFVNQEWKGYGDTGFTGQLPSVWREKDKVWLCFYNDSDGWVEIAGQPGSNTQIRCLVVYHEEIYGGGDDGILYLWDGDEWVAKTTTDYGGINSLVVYEDSIYAGTDTNAKLLEWDGVDDWIARTADVSGYGCNGLVVHDDGSGDTVFGILTNSTDSALYSWNLSYSWTSKSSALSSVILTAIVKLNDGLYASGDDGCLYWWNQSYSRLDEVAGQESGGGGVYSLLVQGGYIYGGAGDGTGGRLLRWDGVSTWLLKAEGISGETKICSLLYCNNNIYGGTYDGGKLLVWDEVSAWEVVADTLGSEDTIYSLVTNDDGYVYAGTGQTSRLYKFTSGAKAYSTVNGTTWTFEFACDSALLKSDPYDVDLEALKFCKIGDRLVLLSMVNSTSEGDEFAILGNYSDDGGVTWRLPYSIDVVNLETVDSAIRRQSFVDVKIDKNGTLVLAYSNKADADSKHGLIRVSYDGMYWTERATVFRLDASWKIFDVGMFVDDLNNYWWVGKCADIANTSLMLATNKSVDQGNSWEYDATVPTYDNAVWNHGCAFTWDGDDYSASIMNCMNIGWSLSRSFLLYYVSDGTNVINTCIGADRSGLPLQYPWDHCWTGGIYKLPEDFGWTYHGSPFVTPGFSFEDDDLVMSWNPSQGTTVYWDKSVDPDYVLDNAKYEFGMSTASSDGGSSYAWNYAIWNLYDGTTETQYTLQVVLWSNGGIIVSDGYGDLFTGSVDKGDVDFVVSMIDRSVIVWHRTRGIKNWTRTGSGAIRSSAYSGPSSATIGFGVSTQRIQVDEFYWHHFNYSMGELVEDFDAGWNNSDLPGTPVSIYGQQFLDKTNGYVSINFNGRNSVTEDSWMLDYVLESSYLDKRNALRSRPSLMWEPVTSSDQSIVLAHDPVGKVPVDTLLLVNTYFRSFQLQAQDSNGTDWSAPDYDETFNLVSETGTILSVLKNSIYDPTQSWKEGEHEGKVLRVTNGTTELLYDIHWNYVDKIITLNEDLVSDGISSGWTWEIIEVCGIVEDLGSIAYNYYRFLIPEQETVGDNHRLGYLWLGNRVELMENPCYPVTSGMRIKGENVKLKSGETKFHPRTDKKKRLINISFPSGSEGLRDQIEGIFSSLGGHWLPFTIVWNYDDNKFDFILGRLLNYPEIARQLFYIRDINLAIEENL